MSAPRAEDLDFDKLRPFFMAGARTWPDHVAAELVAEVNAGRAVLSCIEGDPGEWYVAVDVGGFRVCAVHVAHLGL